MSVQGTDYNVAAVGLRCREGETSADAQVCQPRDIGLEIMGANAVAIAMVGFAQTQGRACMFAVQSH